MTSPRVLVLVGDTLPGATIMQCLQGIGASLDDVDVSGRPPATVQQKYSKAMCLAGAADQVALAALSRCLSPGALVHVHAGPSQQVQCASLAPGGSQAATGQYLTTCHLAGSSEAEPAADGVPDVRCIRHHGEHAQHYMLRCIAVLGAGSTWLTVHMLIPARSQHPCLTTRLEPKAASSSRPLAAQQPPPQQPQQQQQRQCPAPGP